MDKEMIEAEPAPALRRRASALMLAAMLGLNVWAGASLALRPEAPEAAPLPPPVPRPVPPSPPDTVPAPEPLVLKPVDPDSARAWNAAIPLSDLPNPAARPFVLEAASAADRARAVRCLASAVYYEAAIEPVEGQRAVAQVVLNRLRHPAYPDSVCGVVYEGSERRTGCQFTFTCDGSLARAPQADLWHRAERIAEEALAGAVYAPVGWATHYHTDWVVPYWAENLVKAANVGTHIFYRWTGGWGRAPAFAARHRGTEPMPGRAPGETRAAEATTDAADAVAAQAAIEAGTGETLMIDGRPRAVLRRYEPIRREQATEMIARRAEQGGALSAGQRWALTGTPAEARQAPLGAPRDAETAEAPAQEAETR